jgi:Na+/H+-dicarboxylate symporter
MFDSLTITVFVAGLTLGVIATLHGVYRTFRIGSFFSNIAMLYTVARVIRQWESTQDAARTSARVADAVRQFVPAGR